MIKGENIFLRALETSDVDLIYSWENDPEIFSISGNREPLSKTILLKFISSITNLQDDGQLRLMICLNDKIPIGTVELFDYDSVNRRAGVGIMIANSDHRDCGYGTEALQLLLGFCKSLNLKQVYANVIEDNEKSMRLFSKFNFNKVGLKESWIMVNGVWKSEWLLQKILFNGKN
ncbi:MAG: GNAT family N-acetyltransferase [Flavobacteriales bacterium]|nr:GNAT family N-acetyltransferase [Flavobacteriales bacterium]